MIKIAEYSINKSKITLFVAVIIMIMGVVSFRAIPKQDMPDIIPPIASVQILAPGYTLDDVEKYVTKPVEEAVLSVSGVSSIDSITLDNIAIFNIILDINESDTQSIFDEVLSEINKVDLPEGSSEPTIQNILLSPHAIFSVSSDTLTLDELSGQAEIFKSQLASVDKVSSVTIKGSSDLQVYINVNQAALANLGLTMSDFINIINFSGLEIPVGTLITQDGATGVAIPAHFTSLDEINNLVIGMDDLSPVTVSDVAMVSLMENPRNVLQVVNEKSAIFVEVFFEKDIDFTVLGQDLIEVQEEFDQEISSIKIDRMLFEPDLVRDSLNQIYSSLIIGILLVVLIVFIGLGWRNAVSVAFTFPMIILGTIGSLYLLDQDLNRIMVAAIIITIGIIVDNSIVISDSIQYHLDRGDTRLKASLLSVKENSAPVLSSSLTTIAAFIPFMFMNGVQGKLISVLPMTVSISIALSYIAAMFVMPVFGSLFFKPKKKIEKDSTENKTFTKFFEKTLPTIIKKPKTVLFSTIMLLLLSVGLMGATSELVLFPVEDENIIYIDYSYNDVKDPVGAHQFANDIMDEFEDYDEIYYTAYSVGGDLPAFGATTQVNNVPSDGRIFYRLDVPFDDIELYVNEFENKLNDNEELVASGTFSVNQLSMNFGGSADLSLALSSDDYELLVSQSNALLTELSALEDVIEVTIQEQVLSEVLRINIDRELLVQNGLTMIEVQTQIATILNGGSYPIYENNDDIINVNFSSIILSNDDFDSISIKSTLTDTFVPLSSIATFEYVETVSMHQRHNGNHQIMIDIFFAEDANTVLVTPLTVNTAEDFLDDDIKISLGGQADVASETFSTLGIAAIFALIVVYFIMFVQFNSFKLPFIVLTTIPLSFIGSALLVVVTGTPISFTMVFGITSLIGIVVNMGILLIDYINKARENGATVLEACVQSVRRRLRPILLSSITTIMGLIPLALFGGLFFRPMAVSLMGGLIASTILTIFVVPATYYLLENKKETVK